MGVAMCGYGWRAAAIGRAFAQVSRHSVHAERSGRCNLKHAGIYPQTWFVPSFMPVSMSSAVPTPCNGGSRCVRCGMAFAAIPGMATKTPRRKFALPANTPAESSSREGSQAAPP